MWSFCFKSFFQNSPAYFALFVVLCLASMSLVVVVAHFILLCVASSRKSYFAWTSSTINRATCACNSVCWIQNISNFSEADKKVKEIAKQNEWHNVQWDEGEWNKFNSFSSHFLYSFFLCSLRSYDIDECETQKKRSPNSTFFFIFHCSRSPVHTQNRDQVSLFDNLQYNWKIQEINVKWRCAWARSFQPICKSHDEWRQ